MIVRTRQNGEHKVFNMTRDEIAEEIARLKSEKGVRFPCNVTRFVATLDDAGHPIIETVAGVTLRFPKEK